MPSKLSTCQRIEAGLSPNRRVVQISPSTDLSEMIVRLASSVQQDILFDCQKYDGNLFHRLSDDVHKCLKSRQIY